MSGEKIFAHPQKVRREKPIHTPKRCTGEAKITPPKGAPFIINSGGGGRENVLREQPPAPR